MSEIKPTLKPTTLYIGEKANQLLVELASENEMASRFFFTKIIIREARAEATALTADKLKKRLELIGAVNDELLDIINHPPKTLLADRDFSAAPKTVYTKIWTARKRLSERGWSEEEIHDYCLTRYGLDYKIKPQPQKNPKQNPSWVGGGKVAQKIKKAKAESKGLELE